MVALLLSPIGSRCIRGDQANADRHRRLLLEAIFALTKVVEKMHPLPDAFGVAGTYTCSSLIVITATLLRSYTACQQ